ncbi:hypothetical protein [Actinoplanes sp. CA-252034]|uniref:hypothetical protein n=1 Tax=Actinoplanes sp. CA-252034 TaxID=3239906 RepID=UPI003D994AAC
MKSSPVVLAVALTMSLTGLTGCASAADPAPPSASSVPAASEPAEPAMTMKKAGKTYERLSAASNTARDKWMGAPAPTTANLAKHRKLAAGVAEATVAFSEGLRKNRWPAEVQPVITALDEHLRQRAAAYQRVAEAGTLADYLAAASEVPVTSSLTAQVREVLELPRAAAVKGVSPRQ